MAASAMPNCKFTILPDGFRQKKGTRKGAFFMSNGLDQNFQV